MHAAQHKPVNRAPAAITATNRNATLVSAGSGPALASPYAARFAGSIAPRQPLGQSPSKASGTAAPASEGKRMFRTSTGQTIELPADVTFEEAARLDAEAQAATQKIENRPAPQPVPDPKTKATKSVADTKSKAAAKDKRAPRGRGRPLPRRGAAAKVTFPAVGKSRVAQYLASRAAPAFVRGAALLHRLKQNEQTHDNAAEKLSQSKRAVVIPQSENQSAANTVQVKAVSARRSPTVDERHANQQLDQSLRANTPNSIADVDNFKRDMKAQHVSAAVTQVVLRDKNAVLTTFGELRNTPAPVAREQTPAELPPEEVAPTTPAMNLGQGSLAPLQKEHLDVSQFTNEANHKLKEEGITQEQLDLVDSGELAEAKQEKKTLEKTAQTEPLAVQKLAAQQTAAVDKELNQEEKRQRGAMRAKRKANLATTAQQQRGAKTALEKKRDEVARKINDIYIRAQDKVKKKLAALETESLKRFDAGNAKAADAFESNVQRELAAYKADRYSGWFGWARKAKDWLLGMDELPRVKEIFENNRTIFVNTVNALVADISADNRRVIQECKDDLAAAKKEIQEFVNTLGPELRTIGQRTAKEMHAKLTDLDRTVAAKEQELLEQLKNKQTAAIKAIDEKIEKMKEAMAGAVAKLGKLLLWAAKKFFTWALKQFGYSLSEIEGIINKGAAVLKAIFTQPIQFVKNLIQAASSGFKSFGKNFGQHLKDAVFEWLTGSLQGIRLPASWDLKGIASVAFQLLGLTWTNIRSKLVKLVGEKTVEAMETGFDLVLSIVKHGPIAAWEKLQEMADDIKAAFIQGVKDFIQIKIVQKAIETILSLFIPGAGIVRAVVGIYDTIVFFIQKAKQIAQMVGNFLSSIGEIAKGNIGAAAAALEQGLAKGLMLVIQFLVRFLRLSGITAKVRAAMERLRDKVNTMLDKIVQWIVSKAKRLGRFVAQAGVAQDPNERLRLACAASVKAARQLTGRVTGTLLHPVLQAIKLRYGLQELQPYVHSGAWWVKATINPAITQNLGVPAADPGVPPSAAAPTAAPQVAKGGSIQLRGSGGGWRPYRYQIIEVTGTQLEYRYVGRPIPRAAVSGGTKPLTEIGTTWRLYAPRAGELPRDELLVHNGGESGAEIRWTDRTIARRVLNFRHNDDESQSNPAGREWEHIVEATAGGEHSVDNLTLSDATLNRDLGVLFGQRKESAPGFPSTGPLSVREFLDAAGAGVRIRRRWKERFYRIFGVQVKRNNKGRGPYQTLE